MNRKNLFFTALSELLLFSFLFQRQGPQKSTDGIYRQWFTSRHRIVSQNKGGPVAGHYVQIDGDCVSADAVENEDKGICCL